jgi:endogenous inhibitor of DNA gyrase (YacG/DUF329 family)
MASVRCPTCDKLFDPDTSKAMPFCSDRCRKIDLGRWLNEDIGLPYGETADEDERRDDHTSDN